ncbi:MAG: hypothetical protein ABJE47_01470 [bacterium]
MKSLTILAVLLLGTSACGGESAACVIPPCVMSIAVAVTVNSSVTGTPIAGSFVQPTGGGQLPCTQAAESTCRVPGGGGTYELDIGAPGYQTVHRSVTVSSTAPDAPCGCHLADTKQISVALAPAT